MSPFSLLSLQMNLASLAFEAQTVIALRLMGMAGALPAKPGEWNRMVGEKPAAFAESWMRAAEATVAGKPADAILEAAARPLRRKVRANRRRLMR